MRKSPYGPTPESYITSLSPFPLAITVPLVKEMDVGSLPSCIMKCISRTDGQLAGEAETG